MLAIGEHHARERYLVQGADSLADHRKAAVADLAERHAIIGAYEVKVVDLSAGDKLIDLDGAGGFERNIFQFILGNFEVAVFVDLISLDDVFVRDFFAGVSIHLEIADAVPRFLVYLVENGFFGLGGRGEQRDRACHERQSQKTLPVGTWGHTQYSTLTLNNFNIGGGGPKWSLFQQSGQVFPIPLISSSRAARQTSGVAPGNGFLQASSRAR